MALEVQPVSGSIGAYVGGVGLAELTDADFGELRELLLGHCVLIFPGQFLPPEGHRRFARRWGEPVVTPYLSAHAEPGFPEILHVTNPGKANAVTESWHFDSAFFPEPPDITILAAQHLPDVGGDTMWANQYLALEALSPAMRAMLDPLEIEFCGSRPAADGHGREEVSTFHPVVATHPETGRRLLRVGNPDESVRRFAGMTPEESRPLLRFLYGHASRPDLTGRHRWSAGDVVMWDNRCTLHYAIHDYGDAARLLNRVTLRAR